MNKNPAEYLICNCIEADRENVLIIYDDTTEDFINLFYTALINHGKAVEMAKLNIARCHGQEPPDEIADKMIKNDVVMCLTKYSLAHTSARKRAAERNVAFLSLPEYDTDLLNNRAIFVDYHSKLAQVSKYTSLLTNGAKIMVKTESGTSLNLNIQNRKGNCCPGLTSRDYLLGSPPDIEANIAPLENETNGRLIVDGSITDKRIGVLRTPVILDIKEGYIYNILSTNKEIERLLNSIFQEVHSKKAYRVGEFGIGFNDCANLCGNMLIDEGSLGCIHFGIGSNWTIGGENKVNFHLDFVLKNATVQIDNQIVIDKGELIYDN